MFVFIGLELFVGVIQALIFSMLTLVFLSIATVHEDAHAARVHDHIDSKSRSMATARVDMVQPF